MPEILSQEEIDALLSSVEIKEEKPEKKDEKIGAKERRRKKENIRVYDFSSPDKFSKDQIRTLQILHEGFNRLINSSLSAYLRTVVQANLLQVFEQSYEEFIKSLSNPTIIGVFSLLPLEGNAIVEINTKIIYLMFERLLGGKGIVSEKDETRELTDIEQSICEGILIRILNSFRDAWANIIQLSPRLETLETNPGFCQIVAANDRVATLTFEIKVGEITGIMNLCLPHVVLEPIVSKLSAQLWFSGAKTSTSETSSQLRKRLSKAIIPLVVELGDVMLSLSDVLALQKGDVIRLEQDVRSPLKIKISEKVKFFGIPGTRGTKLAVQITKKVIDGGEV